MIANGGSLAPSYQPYTWSVAGGALPAGPSLQEASSQQAWVLGTPTRAGTSTFTAQVTDDAGTTARQSFTITIGTGKLDNIVATQASLNTENIRCSSPPVTPTPT